MPRHLLHCATLALEGVLMKALSTASPRASAERS
jgi:hypothetical protein